PLTVQVSTPTSTRACACASEPAKGATPITAARIAICLDMNPSVCARCSANQRCRRSCNHDQAAFAALIERKDGRACLAVVRQAHHWGGSLAAPTSFVLSL